MTRAEANVYKVCLLRIIIEVHPGVMTDWADRGWAYPDPLCTWYGTRIHVPVWVSMGDVI